MQLSNRIIALPGKPRTDTRAMFQWEKGEITAERAAEIISKNNAIVPPLLEEEFEEFAHSSGFWKNGTMPKELEAEIENYRLAKGETEDDEGD